MVHAAEGPCEELLTDPGGQAVPHLGLLVPPHPKERDRLGDDVVRGDDEVLQKEVTVRIEDLVDPLMMDIALDEEREDVRSSS